MKNTDDFIEEYYMEGDNTSFNCALLSVLRDIRDGINKFNEFFITNYLDIGRG